MPKDEFDFEDPLELNGMAFLTHEDTTDAMAECFIEEFARMGHSAPQVLALFRNPRYVGPNMAFERRGETFVRELIADVFARWGKPVAWSGSDSNPRQQTGSFPTTPDLGRGLPTLAATMELEEGLTDPMGTLIPKLNV